MRHSYILVIVAIIMASCAKEADVVNMMPDIVTGDFVTTSRTSAVLEGSVALNGSTAENIGIVYADDPNMSVNVKYIIADMVEGSVKKISVEVDGLSAGRTYCYRTFVHSSNKYYYGDYKMFTTPQISSPTFEVFKVDDDDVEAAQMQLKAVISDLGVEQGSGVTLSNPSFKYKVVSSSNEVEKLVFSDTDASWQTVPAAYDSASKTLEATVTGLHSATTYAVCAYATTAGFGVSNIVAVTTDATTAPEVSGVEVTSGLGQDVRLKASVTNQGTSAVTERGFVYSTKTEIPLYEGSTAVVADEDFTVVLTNLTNSTKYYIRAYARNANGIGYGAVCEYTTADVVITPTILTVTANDIKSSSAVIVGYFDSKGLDVSSIGFVVNGVRMPVSVDKNGTFTLSLSGLDPSTQYSYNTYCVLSSGDEFMGDELFFTTKNAPVDEEIVYPGME